jgi:hypothetical protein
MFLMGIFATPENKTPKMQIFVSLVVDELTELLESGVVLFDSSDKCSFRFRATCFLASFDYQAVVKLLCIQGCSSSMPCYRCVQLASRQAPEVLGGNTMSCLHARRLLPASHRLRDGERRSRPARRTQRQYEAYGRMAHEALFSKTYADTVAALEGHKDFCELARLPLWDMSIDVVIDDMHLTTDVLGKFTSLLRGTSTPTNAVRNRRVKRRRKAALAKPNAKKRKKTKTARQVHQEQTRLAAEQRYLAGHESLVSEYSALGASKSRIAAIERLSGELQRYLPSGVLRSRMEIFSTHMKAHDCLNVTRWQLLPYLLRHTWPPDQIRAMGAVLDCLREFKKDLPTDEVDQAALEARASEAIVEFSDHFPPSELVTVVHLLFHVPEDLSNWGPCRHRWQYCAERYLGWLVRLVKSRSHPIANALKMNSVVVFATGAPPAQAPSLAKSTVPGDEALTHPAPRRNHVVFPNAGSWCKRKYYKTLAVSE